MSEFNLDQSRAARDEGIDRVVNNNKAFSAAVYQFVIKLPSGWIGTGEDIRRACGLKPHHSNAWGGAMNAVVRDLLKPTGNYVSMKAVKSHARKTPEYRRV